MGVIRDLFEYCEDERKDDPKKPLYLSDWMNTNVQDTPDENNINNINNNRDKPKSLTLDSE